MSAEPSANNTSLNGTVNNKTNRISTSSYTIETVDDGFFEGLSRSRGIPVNQKTEGGDQTIAQDQQGKSTEGSSAARDLDMASLSHIKPVSTPLFDTSQFFTTPASSTMNNVVGTTSTQDDSTPVPSTAVESSQTHPAAHPSSTQNNTPAQQSRNTGKVVASHGQDPSVKLTGEIPHPFIPPSWLYHQLHLRSHQTARVSFPVTIVSATYNVNGKRPKENDLSSIEMWLTPLRQRVLNPASGGSNALTSPRGGHPSKPTEYQDYTLGAHNNYQNIQVYTFNPLPTTKGSQGTGTGSGGHPSKPPSEGGTATTAQHPHTNTPSASGSHPQLQSPANIVAVAFQEIVALNLLNIMVEHTTSAAPWISMITTVLNQALRDYMTTTGIDLDDEYILVSSNQLVGLAMCVWVRKSVAPLVTNVKVGKLGVGVMGTGNKGAVGVSMFVADTSICFLNAHIAAHQHKVANRNEHYRAILKAFKFESNIVFPSAQQQTQQLQQFHLAQQRKAQQLAAVPVEDGHSAARQQIGKLDVNDDDDDSIPLAVNPLFSPSADVGGSHEDDKSTGVNSVDPPPPHETIPSSSSTLSLPPPPPPLVTDVDELPDSSLETPRDMTATTTVGSTSTPAVATTPQTNTSFASTYNGLFSIQPKVPLHLLYSSPPLKLSPKQQQHLLMLQQQHQILAIQQKQLQSQHSSVVESDTTHGLNQPTSPLMTLVSLQNNSTSGTTMSEYQRAHILEQQYMFHSYLFDPRVYESSAPDLLAMDHDYVIWLGDLNYRIAHPDMNHIFERIYNKDISFLIQFDQLLQQKGQGKAFSEFDEMGITFQPTYKYIPGEHQYERRPDKKIRMPSYTDRIQFRSSTTQQIHPIEYNRVELVLSDHKPVRLTTSLLAHVQDPLKQRLLLQRLRSLTFTDITPQIKLSWSRLYYPLVRFNIPLYQTLTVKNTGQCVIRFEAIVLDIQSVQDFLQPYLVQKGVITDLKNPFDDLSAMVREVGNFFSRPVMDTTVGRSRYGKLGYKPYNYQQNSWLTISPKSGVLAPGEKLDLQVKIHVCGKDGHRIFANLLQLASMILVRVQDASVRKWGLEIGPTCVDADYQAYAERMLQQGAILSHAQHQQPQRVHNQFGADHTLGGDEDEGELDSGDDDGVGSVIAASTTSSSSSMHSSSTSTLQQTFQKTHDHATFTEADQFHHGAQGKPTSAKPAQGGDVNTPGSTTMFSKIKSIFKQKGGAGGGTSSQAGGDDDLTMIQNPLLIDKHLSDMSEQQSSASTMALLEDMQASDEQQAHQPYTSSQPLSLQDFPLLLQQQQSIFHSSTTTAQTQAGGQTPIATASVPSGGSGNPQTTATPLSSHGNTLVGVHYAPTAFAAGGVPASSLSPAQQQQMIQQQQWLESYFWHLQSQPLEYASFVGCAYLESIVGTQLASTYNIPIDIIKDITQDDVSDDDEDDEDNGEEPPVASAGQPASTARDMNPSHSGGESLPYRDTHGVGDGDSDDCIPPPPAVGDGIANILQRLHHSQSTRTNKSPITRRNIGRLSVTRLSRFSVTKYSITRLQRELERDQSSQHIGEQQQQHDLSTIAEQSSEDGDGQDALRSSFQTTENRPSLSPSHSEHVHTTTRGRDRSQSSITPNTTTNIDDLPKSSRKSSSHTPPPPPSSSAGVSSSQMLNAPTSPNTRRQRTIERQRKQLAEKQAHLERLRKIPLPSFREIGELTHAQTAAPHPSHPAYELALKESDPNEVRILTTTSPLPHLNSLRRMHLFSAVLDRYLIPKELFYLLSTIYTMREVDPSQSLFIFITNSNAASKDQMSTTHNSSGVVPPYHSSDSTGIDTTATQLYGSHPSIQPCELRHIIALRDCIDTFPSHLMYFMQRYNIPYFCLGHLLIDYLNGLTEPLLLASADVLYEPHQGQPPALGSTVSTTINPLAVGSGSLPATTLTTSSETSYTSRDVYDQQSGQYTPVSTTVGAAISAAAFSTALSAGHNNDGRQFIRQMLLYRSFNEYYCVFIVIASFLKYILSLNLYSTQQLTLLFTRPLMHVREADRAVTGTARNKTPFTMIYDLLKNN